MDPAKEARLLEEELEDAPDERDVLLLDVARAWRRAGNHERAIQLLTEAIELGVEDHDCPRVVLAEVLFELGRDDEARAQLRTLRKSWPESPEPYEQAGDLMRNRGEFEEALNWYDLAIARQDPDERSDNFAAVNRRGVRRELGLPPDDLDASVEHLERHLDDIVRQARAKMAAPPDPPR